MWVLDDSLDLDLRTLNLDPLNAHFGSTVLAYIWINFSLFYLCGCNEGTNGYRRSHTIVKLHVLGNAVLFELILIPDKVA